MIKQSVYNFTGCVQMKGKYYVMAAALLPVLKFNAFCVVTWVDFIHVSIL